jgi:hypothetical protein
MVHFDSDLSGMFSLSTVDHLTFTCPQSLLQLNNPSHTEVIWAFSSTHNPNVLLGQQPVNVAEHTGLK